MPKSKIDESFYEMRSVLMRLYHIYWQGEEFYPARFVNGCAPAMEANGWIEKHGDGWRITDDGIDHWAELNRHALMLQPNQRSYLHGSQFSFLRDRLAMEGRSDMGICKKEGCDKPRHISIGGTEFSFCHEHQKEQWAAAKREQNQTKKQDKPARPRATKPPVKRAGNWVDGEPLPPNVETVISHVVSKVDMNSEPLPMDEPEEDVMAYAGMGALGHALASMSRSNGTSESFPAVNPVEHDCNKCEAKAVIEALRAKSPKLAKLIDAMQAEVEAAAELGL